MTKKNTQQDQHHPEARALTHEALKLQALLEQHLTLLDQSTIQNTTETTLIKLIKQQLLNTKTALLDLEKELAG